MELLFIILKSSLMVVYIKYALIIPKKITVNTYADP